MNLLFVSHFPSSLGTFAIVWGEGEAGQRVVRILLPQNGSLITDRLSLEFPRVGARSCSFIRELGKQLQSFLEGHDVSFSLDSVALERCSSFQRRVLRTEHRIPRGWVTTYGRIARRIGYPQGARAVGQALARNPFPLIVPCHRAISRKGGLGGFQGGLVLKRKLLEREGIQFLPNGSVCMTQVYY